MLINAKKQNDKIVAYYNSSNILATEFYFNDLKLNVIFESGRVYQYSDISLEDYIKLQQNSSTGTYFTKNIKNKYKTQRLDDIDTSVLKEELQKLKEE